MQLSSTKKKNLVSSENTDWHSFYENPWFIYIDRGTRPTSLFGLSRPRSSTPDRILIRSNIRAPTLTCITCETRCPDVGWVLWNLRSSFLQRFCLIHGDIETKTNFTKRGVVDRSASACFKGVCCWVCKKFKY